MTEWEQSRWAAALAGGAPPEEKRPAAVLVPLVEGEEGPSLLFEVRAARMQDQPGEVCFPGGGMEPGETPEGAALREAEEELSLPREQVTVLGALPPLRHSSMRLVYPIVGAVPSKALERLIPAPAEVERWFTVPLDWFRRRPPELCRYTLAPQNVEEQPEAVRAFLTRHRVQRESLYWPWEGASIWGLTARVLHQLLERLPDGEEETAAPEEELWQLETNLDDVTGEALGLTLELLLAAGAKDVWYQPIFMKKSRPAYLLCVLCAAAAIPGMEEIIFTHTTTTGIRRTAVERTALPRQMERVSTPLGAVRVKRCTLPTGAVRGYPEYEDVAALARATGWGYQEVYELARGCWAERRTEE